MRRISRFVTIALTLALTLAGCASDGDNGDGTTDGGAGGSTVAFTGTDGLMFEPDEATASAGTITVELTAESGVNHTFVVEGEQGDGPVAEADAGATATGTIELEPGTYTFYCDVTGHRDAGMEGELVVE